MNCILYNRPKIHLDKLQRVQNVAARMSTSVGNKDHITPVLEDLHCLPICQCINYKILLFTYMDLHQNIFWTYLNQYHIQGHSTQILDSFLKFHGQLVLHMEIKQHLSYEILCLRTLKRSDSVDIFKRKFKAYLFKQAFLVLVLLSLYQYMN